MALHGGIGVGIESGGLSGGFPVMDDPDRARRRCLWVVAQGHGLPHEQGIDLVQASLQAHGAVLHDASFGLEQEQVVEVEGGVGVAHAVAGERPLLEGGARVEATMGSVVVLALDPRPEASVERLEALGVFVPEVAEPSGAQGSEKSS